MNDPRTYYAVVADMQRERGEWLFAEVARQRGAELAVRPPEEWELERPIGATRFGRVWNYVTMSEEVDRVARDLLTFGLLLLGVPPRLAPVDAAMRFVEIWPTRGAPCTPLQVAAFVATYMMLPQSEQVRRAAARERDEWMCRHTPSPELTQ